MLQILFLVIQLGIAIYLLYMCIAFIIGAPFVATKSASAESMIRLAHIQKGTKVYDLGSGDGKLLFLAAERGARAIGYEINPLLVIFSNLKAFFSRYRRNVKTEWKNFWNADVRDADVILVYLLPTRMEKLKAKLKKECRKRTIVISNCFIFPHWKILRQDADNHIYVFRV